MDTIYKERKIDERYADLLSKQTRGNTPKFLALMEIARQTEAKARKTGNQALQMDADAMRRESARLREEAGIPLKQGWSSEGYIGGHPDKS